MRTLAKFSYVLMGMLCAGCTLLPVPDDAASELPDTWSIDAASALKPPDKGWWKAFGSQELNTLLEGALLANRNLDTVRQNMEQARIQWQSSQMAKTPEVNSAFSKNLSGVWGEHQRNKSYGANLSLSYSPDVWGAKRAASYSNEALWRAASYDVSATALMLRSSVITQYLALLGIRRQIVLAEKNLDISRRLLALVETKYAAGAVARLDLAQQQSFVAGMEVMLLQLHQQSRQVSKTLAALLDKTPQELIPPSQHIEDLRMPDIGSGLPADLMHKRPDLLSAEAKLAAAGANIDAARAAMFPSISLSATSSVSATGLNPLFRLAPGWGSGLEISLPIWDRSARVDNQRLALINRKIALNAYREALLTAFGDVETALHAMLNLQQQQRWQDAQLAAAQDSLRLAEIRYRAGAEDLQRLLNAQNVFYSAELASSTLWQQRLQAANDLAVALGGSELQE
ncbi:efflux transporter outer membrane subunit [Pectobacterium aroidearum]|uniref:efflux transporter outer membrane subunit n=1 Tax=Pectobacterium aroidearum TaxID=1201031 RepID=UPI0015F4ED69|nr:efflux transporter outer membrane subunit [Pectobacterium aroidearum]MBA5599943.1 efflux transporter outer membrane subunit [Pectobacterium aroidearum]